MPAASRSKLSRAELAAKREAHLRKGNKEAMYIGKQSVVVLYWEPYYDSFSQNTVYAFTIDVELHGERTRRHRFETFAEAQRKWKELKRTIAIQMAEKALNLERPRE